MLMVSCITLLVRAIYISHHDARFACHLDLPLLSLLPLLLLVLSRLRPLTSSSDGLLLLAVSTRFRGGDLSLLRPAGEAPRLRDLESEREADRERLEPEPERELEEPLLPELELELEDPESDPELELDETDVDLFRFFSRSFSFASKILSAVPAFDVNSSGTVVGG